MMPRLQAAEKKAIELQMRYLLRESKGMFKFSQVGLHILAKPHLDNYPGHIDHEIQVCLMIVTKKYISPANVGSIQPLRSYPGAGFNDRFRVSVAYANAVVDWTLLLSASAPHEPPDIIFEDVRSI
jgi:hypothetical protein